LLSRITQGTLALYWIAGIFGCTKEGPKGSPDIMVFAAASMRGVAEELGQTWERSHPGDHVHYNFAGSNDLAKQIGATNQADVFISASEEWADVAEKSGKMIAGSRQVIAHNNLVVIAPVGSLVKVAGAIDVAELSGELVLANPDAVPAGKYARSWLQGKMYAGRSVWDVVKDRVVPMPDVRAALAMVAQRPQSVGIVYVSDLKASDKVKSLYAIPASECPPIRIVAMALSGPAGRERALGFVTSLRSPSSQEAFKKNGFEIPLGP
jgi:molybdate transport system substrate-binding protein